MGTCSLGIARSLAIGAAILASGSVFAGSIVVDGDFEQRSLSNPSYDRLFAPNVLGGWVLESGSVDQIGTFWAAASGSKSVDLSGTDSAPQANGSIYQKLVTVPGDSYDLTFALAGSPTPYFGGVKKVEVRWAGSSLGIFSFDSTSKSVTNMGWIEVVVPNLLATAGVTELKFINIDVGTPGYGAALDNVRVTPTAVVPLPAAAWMGLALLGSAGFQSAVRRWRTR